MRIKSVELTDYRNYEKEKISFGDGLNVVFGKNAGGKTNLAEAIYFCGLGKSPRTPREKELIRWEKPFAQIKIVLEKKYREHTVVAHIDAQGKKRIAIDGIPISKMADLMGVLNVVFFSPDELSIIKEGPQERRRFLDISLSQQKKSYYQTLVNYNRALAQRNKVLKTEFKKETLSELLPIWESQLVKDGVKLIIDRADFVSKLAVNAQKWHSILTGGKESLTMEYESKILPAAAEVMTAYYTEAFVKAREKDIFLQYTSVGCHRDDIALAIDGADVRKFGSQGQKRSVALSMKLAEADLFRSETGETPILILDDVLSELDPSRQKQLLEAARTLQTVLTCTHFDGDCDTMTEIREGKAYIVRKNGKN